MIIAIAGQAKSGKDTAADFLVKNHGFVKVAFADEIKRCFYRMYPKTPKENLWGASELRNLPLEMYPREHGPWVADAAMVSRCACCNVPQGLEGGTTCYLTCRFGLQQLGTEYGRMCYPHTWTDLTMDVAKYVLFMSGILRSVHYSYSQEEGLLVSNVPKGPKPKGVVISDLRWPQGNEGDAVRAHGGLLWRMKRGTGLTGASGQHASELAMGGVPDSFFDDVFANQDMTLEELEAEVSQVVHQRMR